MVPGSTLRYGSNFCMITRNPRCSSKVPSAAAARPLPSELTTPPVTKIYFIRFSCSKSAVRPGSRPRECLPRVNWSRKRRRESSCHFPKRATVRAAQLVRANSEAALQVQQRFSAVTVNAEVSVCSDLAASAKKRDAAAREVERVTLEIEDHFDVLLVRRFLRRKRRRRGDDLDLRTVSQLSRKPLQKTRLN